MRQLTSRFFVVGSAVIGLTIMPSGLSHRVIATGPQLTINLRAGAPASTIRITGAGFFPSEAVSLYWNGSSVETLVTSSRGTFVTALLLARTAVPGPRSIVARGSRGDQARAAFSVAGPPNVSSSTAAMATAPAVGATVSISPSSGAPGSLFVVTISGFKPYEIVTIGWNGSVVATLVTASSGMLATTFSLASTAAPGMRTVTVKGNGGDQGTANFTVLAASTSSNPSPTLSAVQAPTATPPPSANPPTSGSTGNGCAITPVESAAEQNLLGTLNQERAVAGVPPLTLDETISGASRQHSCDMLLNQQLDHLGSDGSDPYQRISSTGVTYTSAGENIGMAGGYTLSDGVDVLNTSMMAEPLEYGNHHWDIVNPAYTRVGLGIVLANDQVWLTEDFIG